jgi:hypothetical protein
MNDRLLVYHSWPFHIQQERSLIQHVLQSAIECKSFENVVEIVEQSLALSCHNHITHKSKPWCDITKQFQTCWDFVFTDNGKSKKKPQVCEKDNLCALTMTSVKEIYCLLNCVLAMMGKTLLINSSETCHNTTKRYDSPGGRNVVNSRKIMFRITTLVLLYVSSQFTGLDGNELQSQDDMLMRDLLSTTLSWMHLFITNNPENWIFLKGFVSMLGDEDASNAGFTTMPYKYSTLPPITSSEASAIDIDQSQCIMSDVERRNEQDFFKKELLKLFRSSIHTIVSFVKDTVVKPTPSPPKRPQSSIGTLSIVRTTRMLSRLVHYPMSDSITQEDFNRGKNNQFVLLN